MGRACLSVFLPVVERNRFDLLCLFRVIVIGNFDNAICEFPIVSHVSDET